MAGWTHVPPCLQSMEEEYYADTRNMACHAVQAMLAGAADALSDEQRRALYPELIKRLDDSNNSVRITICGALKLYVSRFLSPSDSTAAQYMLPILLLHMDDADPGVQETVCQVVCSLAAVMPNFVAEETAKIQQHHHAQQFCERVLAACQGQSNNSAPDAMS